MKGGVYPKHVCKCGNWKRTPGVCQKCGTPLKPKGYGYTWKDAEGKNRFGSAKNKTRAVDARAEKIKEAEKGLLLAGKLTFDGLCTKWLEVRGIKRRSPKRAEGIINNHLLPFFSKEIHVTKLTKLRVEEYVAFRDGKCADATIGLEAGILRTIWNFALKHKYATEDILDGLSLPTQDEQQSCPLTLKQEERLDAGLSQCGTKPYFQFLSYTGCRRGEALALKWSNIDFESGIAWVPGKSRKRKNETQAVLLDEEAIAVLRSIKPITEHVFVNPRTKKPWNNPNATLTGVCKRLGLPHVRIHDLRHLYVSRMLQNGAELKAVSQLARHSDIRMTLRYAHLQQEHLRAALAKRKKPETKSNGNQTEGDT